MKKLPVFLFILLISSLYASSGSGTIQDCYNNKWDYCNISSSSTLTSLDFNLQNRYTILEAGVTITLQQSRLTINTTQGFEWHGTINGNGSQGSGRGVADNYYGWGAPKTASGGYNGGAGQYESYFPYVCAPVPGEGGGSSLPPFEYTSGSAGSAGGGGGFYAGGGAYARATGSGGLGCQISRGGYSGTAIRIITPNLIMDGFEDNNGEDGSVTVPGDGIGGAGGGGGAGEALFYVGNFNFTGLIGLEGGVCSAYGSGSCSDGDDGKLKVCHSGGYINTGTINIGTGTFDLVSSASCFQSFVVSLYPEDDFSINVDNPSPTLNFTIMTFNDTYLDCRYSQNGVNTSLGSFHVDNTTALYNFTPTIQLGTNNITVYCNDTTNTYSSGELQINGTRIYPIYLSAFPTSAYETENNTVTINANASYPYTIVSYEIDVFFNNTQISYSSGSTSISEINASFVDPLVETNTNKNVDIFADLEIDIGGTTYERNYTINQTHTILLYYQPTNYTVTPNAAYTVEELNTANITIPIRPNKAIADVSYSNYTYSLGRCELNYANGSTLNSSCGVELVINNMTNITIPATHKQINGVIFSDAYINRTYSISYSGQPEAISSKIVNDTGTNTTREYFVWLTNSSGGSIAGAVGLTDLYQITFIDELNLSTIAADTALFNYQIRLNDGTTKNFMIAAGGTPSALNGYTIQGYPIVANVSITSEEFYTKSGYTTRKREQYNIQTPFSYIYGIDIYLLPTNSSTASLIYVIDGLNTPIPNEQVKVFKFFPANSTYYQIDDQTTNGAGIAVTNVDTSGYYYFFAYNTNHELEYSSLSPEQFVCISGTCSVTLRIVKQGYQNVTLPTWNYEINDISWRFYPQKSVIFNATNASFQIIANYSDLILYGMQTFYSNTTDTIMVCETNVTGYSSGGIIYCEINRTGTYIFEPYWQVENFSLRRPIPIVVVLSNGTAYQNAFTVFKNNQPIGPWGFYAIALVCAMLAGGYVSRYTIDGAGLVVVATLWFFTFFNPDVCLNTIVGGICITPMLITSFTTVIVVAVLYLGRYL